MFDTEDDDFESVVIDAIEDAIGASSGGPDPRKVVAERLTDAMRIGHERGGEEVDDGDSDGLRKFLCNGALGRRGEDEFVLPRCRHERRRRTATTPRRTSPRA